MFYDENKGGKSDPSGNKVRMVRVSPHSRASAHGQGDTVEALRKERVELTDVLKDAQMRLAELSTQFSFLTAGNRRLPRDQYERLLKEQLQLKQTVRQTEKRLSVIKGSVTTSSIASSQNFTEILERFVEQQARTNGLLDEILAEL